MLHIFASIITAHGGANTNVIYEMESLFEALGNRSRPDLMYRQRWLPFNSGFPWARNMSKDTLVVPDIRLNYTWPILFVPCNTERVQYIGPESHQNRRYFMHSYTSILDSLAPLISVCHTYCRLAGMLRLEFSKIYAPGMVVFCHLWLQVGAVWTTVYPREISQAHSKIWVQ